MLTLLDVDSDKVDKVTLHASNNPSRTLSHDLQKQLWVGTERDNPYPHAGFATCDDSTVTVAGSWRHPARLKITQLSGANAGTSTLR